MSTASTHLPTSPPASPRAILALVLGIVGLAACGLFSPFAWILGAHELNDIRAWRAPRAGEAPALAGMVLGVIGTIPFLVILGFVLLTLPVLLLLAAS